MATFTTDCRHALADRYSRSRIEINAVDDGVGDVVYGPRLVLLAPTMPSRKPLMEPGSPLIAEHG